MDSTRMLCAAHLTNRTLTKLSSRFGVREFCLLVWSAPIIRHQLYP